MDLPRAFQVIGICETNVFALVMRKIQIVLAQLVCYPIRYLNEGRPIDVITFQFWQEPFMNDWVVGKTIEGVVLRVHKEWHHHKGGGDYAGYRSHHFQG